MKAILCVLFALPSMVFSAASGVTTQCTIGVHQIVNTELCLVMAVPVPLNNADHSRVATPCLGGDPSPGPSCRCFSNKAGYSKCLAKSGFVPCDYNTDCGIAPPGMMADGNPATTVPMIGAFCPSWLVFTF